MKRFFRISISLILIILSGNLGCGCRPNKPASAQGQKKKPPMVKTQPVTKGDISVSLELTGECLPINSVTLGSTVEGPARCCFWREGDAIEQGSILIQIDRPQYREEVAVAEAALEVALAKLKDAQAGSRPEEIAQAKERVNELTECTAFTRKDMERCAKLVKNGSLAGEAYEKAKVSFTTCQTKLAAAKERLDMLEAGSTVTEIAIQQSLVKEAKAKLELARAKLAECTIIAPFSGIITKVYFRPGDLAKAKTTLLEMIDPGSIVVRFAVPEAQSTKVQKGMRVLVAIDAYPEQIFHARISHLYPELDSRTRTRKVEAILEKGPQLEPGMFVRLKVIQETISRATVAPNEAILTDSKGNSIAFVVESGKAVKRQIKKGIEEAGKVQIVGGLTPGEQVIVAGQEKLKDGTDVRLDKGKGNKTAHGKGGV